MAAFGTERPTPPGSCCSRPERPPTTCSSCSRVRSRSCGDDGADEVVVADVRTGRLRRRADAADGPAPLPERPRAREPGRVLVIAQAEFRRLMSLRPALAETIFSALRRAARDSAIRAGSPGDPDHRLALLARGDEPARRSPSTRASPTPGSTSRTPRTSMRCSRSMGLGPQDTPVVITPTGILRRATPATLRRAARADLPARRPATSSISSSSAAARPGWPPRSTAPRRV